MPNLTPPSRPSSAFIIRPPVPVKKPSAPVVKPPAPVVKPNPEGLIRCLYVGINYEGFPQLKLNGCINDVNNISNLMRKFYPKCKDHRMLTDFTQLKPNKKNVLESIDWLVKDLKPGQNVFFHYSGHGGRIPDVNQDETSGFDSCIHPYDGNILQVISDDELRIVLANKIPVGCKCFVVLDSCHSGSALDLRYNWICESEGKLNFEQNEKYAKTYGSIIFLSGCQDAQYSMDTVNADGIAGGALTNALLYVWSQYKFQLKVKHLLWDIRGYLKIRNYEQIPQLSCGTQISSEDILDLSK